MRNSFRISYKFLFRALLLSGVLAALLFSSGEGIRLLPFPSFAAQNEKSFLNDGRESDYKKNVFRFEKGEGSFLKFQRSSKDCWTESSKIPQKSPVFKLAVIFQTDSAFISRSFKSRFISRSAGSRAPPFS